MYWVPAPDVVSCTNACEADPDCEFVVLMRRKRCHLKRDVFSGQQAGSRNVRDPSIVSVCLKAWGAPDTSEWDGLSEWSD